MAFDADFAASTLATLLVVMDPPLQSALFLGVTHGMGKAERNEVALRASIIAFCILVVAGLVGARLLGALGITVAAFRIAGGLLLFTSAFDMIFDRRSAKDNETVHKAIDEDHIRNVAAFPLAIPLMAGPGAITAMILLSGRAGDDIMKLGTLFVITLAVVVSCLMAFYAADWISKTLGVTGRAVLTRVLGLVLAALAVQFVIDGMKSVWIG